MTVQLRFSASRDSQYDISKGVFVYFLNSGAVDDLIVSFNEPPATKNASDVGLAFITMHRDTACSRYKAWLETQPLGKFLLEGLGYSFEHFTYEIGSRIKKINPKYSVSLPKDLGKSFVTKAANLIPKFATAYAKYSEERKKQHGCNGISDWVRVALTTNTWLPNSDLEKIRSLHRKYSEIQSLTEAAEEVIKLAGMYEITVA